MIQITLNNSLMTSVPPSNITPAECQKLVPLVKGGGGFIPDHLPWQAKTFCGEEYAMFDFRRNREDIALLHGAAWTPKGAEAVWTLMEHCYASTLKAHSPYGNLDWFMGNIPNMPTDLPLLVTWIMPGAIVSANPEDLVWMTLVGQRLARTIVAMIRDGWW